MTTERFTTEDNIAQTKSTIEALDTHRANELANAQSLQQVNADAQDKELDRLVKKYGEQHPRVQKIQARQVYNKEMFVGLNHEVDRANIKTSFSDASAWQIHGRVYDGKAEPLNKVTVFLADTTDKSPKTIGFSCTDERGYYSIILDENKIKEYEQRLDKIYLLVYGANQSVIFRSKEPVQISQGHVEYRDIFIETQKDTCQEPNVNVDSPQ